MQKQLIFLSLFCFTVSLTHPLWADEGPDDNEALRREIQALKGRLTELERRLEKTEAQAKAKVSEGPMLPEERYKLPEFMHDLTISGMAVASGNYNVNRPGDRLNRFHQFDATADTFQIDEAQLIFHKHPEEGIGFRTDLVFAEIAQNIGSSGTLTTDDIDVEQAYVNYRFTPSDRPLDIWFGKYVTLAGAEVIEDPSNYNWNITHSFMFYYAIPFTHTGMRATYAPMNWATVIVGVNNGWDALTDNNHAKTLETGLSLTPYDWLSWFTSFYYGAEQSGDQGNQRSLVTSVLTLKPAEKLTAMAEADYAFEEAGVSTTTDAEWWGIAGYLRYMLSEKWGFSARAEFFDDNDGVRTLGTSGSGSANGGPSSRTPQELWEFTVTTDYMLYPGLVGRLEYRHDESDHNLFLDGGTSASSANDDSQDMVSLQALYAF